MPLVQHGGWRQAAVTVSVGACVILVFRSGGYLSLTEQQRLTVY